MKNIRLIFVFPAFSKNAEILPIQRQQLTDVTRTLPSNEIRRKEKLDTNDQRWLRESMSNLNLNSTVRMYAKTPPAEQLQVAFRLWHSLDYNKLFDLADYLIDICDIDLSSVPSDIMEDAARTALQGNAQGAAESLTDYLSDVVDPVEVLTNFFLSALGQHQDIMVEKLEHIFEMTEIESYKKLSKGLVLPLNPVFFGDATQFVTLPDDYYLYSMDGDLLITTEDAHMLYDLVFLYIRRDCRKPGKPVTDDDIRNRVDGNFDPFGMNGGNGGSALGKTWKSCSVYSAASYGHTINGDVFPYLCGCQRCWNVEEESADVQKPSMGGEQQIYLFGGLRANAYSPCGPLDGYSEYPSHVYPHVVDMNTFGTFAGLPEQLGHYTEPVKQANTLMWRDTYGVFTPGAPCGALNEYFAYALSVRGPNHYPLTYEWSVNGVFAYLPTVRFFWQSDEWEPGDPGDWPWPQTPAPISVLTATAILTQLGLRITKK